MKEGGDARVRKGVQHTAHPPPAERCQLSAGPTRLRSDQFIRVRVLVNVHLRERGASLIIDIIRVNVHLLERTPASRCARGETSL